MRASVDEAGALKGRFGCCGPRTIERVAGMAREEKLILSWRRGDRGSGRGEGV